MRIKLMHGGAPSLHSWGFPDLKNMSPGKITQIATDRQRTLERDATASASKVIEENEMEGLLIPEIEPEPVKAELPSLPALEAELPVAKKP